MQQLAQKMLETAIEAVEAHSDYRLLRRIPETYSCINRYPKMPLTRIAVLDCETSGLDAERDRIIELAIGTLLVDASGQAVAADEPVSWLEDPGKPLSGEVQRVTGLTDADLQGQALDERDIEDLLSCADVIVAWNASFDAPFFEKRLPQLAGRPWACAMREIDWPAYGIEGRAQAHVLSQLGYFYEAHRAATDVSALLWLLGLQTQTGESFAAELLDAARADTYRVSAWKAPYALRHDLRQRGYRWNPGAKVWSRECSERRRDEELEWLARTVPHIRPTCDVVDWRRRHMM